MPTRATTHIQKTAPGPPINRAAATPKTLPTPTRAAREIVKAWKEEIPPFASVREDNTALNMAPRWRNCMPLEMIVRNIPTPSNTHIVMCNVTQSATAKMPSAREPIKTSGAKTYTGIYTGRFSPPLPNRPHLDHYTRIISLLLRTLVGSRKECTCAT